MKKFLLSVVMLLVSVAMVYAAPQPIKFNIYPRSAIVSFATEVNVEQTFKIPGNFDPSSVKIVSVRGANLISFNAEATNKTDDNPPYYLVIAKKELNMLQNQLNIKLAKQSALDLSAAILDSVTAEKVNPATLPTLVANAAKLRETNAKALIALDDQIETLKQKIKIKQEQIASKLPSNFNKVTLINIRLSGKGNVIFQAETNSAGWQPKYNMNLNTKTGIINTTLSVNVKQNTGMLWNGAMEFYSNVPVRNIFYRKLQPILVAIKPPQPTPRPLLMSNARSVSADEDRSFQATPGHMLTVAPSVNDTGVYFKINATIQGDGSEISLPVEKFDIKSDAGFEITPEYSKYALLTAYIKNLPRPLFNAKGDLAIDGSYSATNNIIETPQGGQLTIPFGESKNITASKNLNVAKKQSSWIKGALKDGYSINILNGLERNITLTVNDRIPYSTDSKISVTNVNITPKTSNDKNGVYQWKLYLKPKESKKISVDYQVKYPTDSEIMFR